jgi:hypothetical protein
MKPTQIQVNRPERKPRVVCSQQYAATLLGVSDTTIGRYLDTGELEPWFAPSYNGAKRRRMVTMASIEMLLGKGTVPS